MAEEIKRLTVLIKPQFADRRYVITLKRVWNCFAYVIKA